MKISVLIPTYKPNPGHLREMLNSLMAQTESDFHCVICDEPTETDTGMMVREYLKDPRFTFHRNAKRLGIGGNWNRCLSFARAPVIAFLFQDDVWTPDYLATGLRILRENANVGFVSLNHAYQFEGELFTRIGYEQLDRIKREVLHAGPWSGAKFLTMWLRREMHPNLIGEPSFVMLRREVTEEIGPFTEKMPQFLDVEYWLRCLLVTDWFYEETPHGTFRVHEEGASYRNNLSGDGLYDRLTCYQMLIDRLNGNMRKLAIASRNRAVEEMAKKFLMRLRRGQSVSAKGGGQIGAFVLRHPFVAAAGMWNVIRKRK